MKPSLPMNMVVLLLQVSHPPLLYSSGHFFSFPFRLTLLIYLLRIAFHSNTERGYLWARLKPILEQEILQDWAHTRATYEVINDGPNGLTQEDHILNDPRCIVAVSNQDRDPYQILRIDTI